jgi:excisionase family DNA binding protein
VDRIETQRLENPWDTPGHTRAANARYVSPSPPALGVVLSEALVTELAERVTEHVLEQVGAQLAALTHSPYLTVTEAAEHLRAKPQRVYDLLSSGRLRRYKDGSRVLVSRAEIDAYLSGSGPNRVAPALPHSPQRRISKRIAA